MTNLLVLLAIVGAAAGAAASVLIWTLLLDPTSLTTAIAAGDLRSLALAVLEAWWR